MSRREADSVGRRIGRWLGRLGLLLFGLVLAMVGAELGVRMLSPRGYENILINTPDFYDDSIFQADTELRQVLKPGAVALMQTPEFRTEVRVSSLGTRGPELGEKAPGTLRVLTVGDSFTLGVQVDEDETFSGRLGPLLSEALGVPVEVVNGGVDGYGTGAAWRRAARLVGPAQIDAVVMTFFTNNDYLDNAGFNPGSYPANMPELPPNITPEQERWRWSHLYFYLEARAREESFSEDSARRRHFSEILRLYTDPPAVERLMPRTREAMVEFRDFCQRQQLTCLVAVAPPAFVVHTERVAPTFALLDVPGEPDLERPARELLKALPKDLAAVDLTPALRAAAVHDATYFTFDGHWTAAGHAAAAGAMAARLAEPDLAEQLRTAARP